MPEPIVAATAAGASTLVSSPLIVAASVVVVVIMLVFRRIRGPEDPLELVFRGAPIGDGVVLACEQVTEEDAEPLPGAAKGKLRYRISYEVTTPQGHEYHGWEEKYLAPADAATAFSVGTRHRVAYRLGSDQVRARTRRHGGPPARRP
ncbi:hypothetical protein [Ruania albidiflava]|uniref:hypothetical protein n=1 Tax=Ruania albidiflava TaxID=366586 RepID=UPI0003B61D5A|nr:hypothetical protein [Ruania albidiflava]